MERGGRSSQDPVMENSCSLGVSRFCFFPDQCSFAWVWDVFRRFTPLARVWAVLRGLRRLFLGPVRGLLRGPWFPFFVDAKLIVVNLKSENLWLEPSREGPLCGLSTGRT